MSRRGSDPMAMVEDLKNQQIIFSKLGKATEKIFGNL